MSITSSQNKIVSNFICSRCAHEVKKIENKVEVFATCKDCTAESLFNRGHISKASALKFCSCYASGHRL